MATAHVMDATNGAPTPLPTTATGRVEPEKRPVGRPRKNPLPPTPPVAPGDADDIQIFLATSTDDEWALRVVYIWRYQPHTKGSKPTSAGQFSSKFDFTDVLKTMGSGVYRFDVVQNPPGGIWPDQSTKGKRIRQGFATIINPDYPPNIPLGDWTEDARNADWQWCVPMLEAKYAQFEEDDEDEGDDTPMYGQSPDQMLETIKKGVDMFRGESEGNAKLAAQMLSIAEKNAEQMRALLDPGKQFETMQRLMAMVAPKQDTTIVDLLRDELKASREELRELRKEIRESQARPFAAQLQELIPVLQTVAPMLGFGKGRAAAAEGVSWADVTVQVADKLSPVLQAIIERSGQTPAPAPVQFTQAPPPSGPHGSTPQPSVHPNAARPQPINGEPSGPLPPNVTADQVKAEQDKLNAIVRKHGSLFANIASAMVDMYQNENGYDFRDWLIDRKGKELWRTLKTDIEIPERLVALTQMSPVLRSQLRPDQKLFNFMKDFLTEIGEEDIEEEPIEGAPKNAA